MKFLFCCEFYYPSVGGVQEVMKQIAERLVARGHEVTVATTALPNRDFTVLNGVQIAQFAVTGNLVRGMHGEISRYRQFVRTFACDAILIKAAQQWTFDALWPDLEAITARKVFIPCGFLSLYQAEYQAYFKYLPEVLRQFDALIFYADNYRDINYAREHQIPNCVVLSNGASEKEFEAPIDSTFRARHKIPENSFLILTVGSLTGAKGHLELAQAIALMPENGHDITLLLNGNDPFPKAGATEVTEQMQARVRSFEERVSAWLGRLQSQWIDLKKGLCFLLANLFHPLRVARKVKGWRKNVMLSQLTPHAKVEACITQINTQSAHKRALLLDLSRADLIQAYLAADLFVFASHVEYSPLVLFEAAAAGTPFITSNAGNAKEIIAWLGGGFMMNDSANPEGFRLIDPQVLADEIAALMNQKSLLEKTGKQLKASWQKDYTWDVISQRYEKILKSTS
jgi:glycosyltransferase involved in cell wall biosynthesis